MTSSKRQRLVVVSALAAAMGVAGFFEPATFGRGKKMSQPPFEKRMKVPTLPAGLTWLNTAGPIELRALRGKFVLLDFWTYCCINCMHILPELQNLERAYPDSLVVIGVHSAKFETERDSKNITEAILRYHIEHPVINDANHAVWELFGVNAWPTVILIDPEGYAVWGTSGEISFEQVDALLKPAIPYYRSKGLLDTTPLRFELAVAKSQDTSLRFPGKVLADEPSGRLFIADSNHNRIVVTRLDGTLLEAIGSGVMGRADGDFASAQFNQPQGMALRGEELFVADTDSHLIRRVDLAKKTVTTVAGVGRQARAPAPPTKTSSPLKTPLSSPWDLWLHEDYLYIAMAGAHQIWRMRLDRPAIGPYAGNGREDIVDGPLLPKQPYQPGASSFAQPSGLASDGTWLYVADSEGSSIRAVPLRPRQEVRTLVGTSRMEYARLFTFGDVDGPPQQARLQHPLGVAFHGGRLYVADTYNNKIKAVDPATGTTRTLAGTGKPGRADNPPQFDEPAGISAAAGRLFVADTNNHLIRVVDPVGQVGNLPHVKVSTLAIPGLAPPKPPAASKPSFVLPGAARETLQPVAVRPESGKIRLAVDLQLPPGYKINEEAPTAYRVDFPAASGRGQTAEGRGQRGPILRKKFGKSIRVEKPAAKFEISLPVDAQTGRDTLEISLNYFYCQSGAEGLCKAGSVVWTVPIELAPDAATSVVPLRHRVR